ncbi:MAG TPA: hypothetical protein VGJ60_16570 [Chloroflexota bacterium]|jgi:hypothetical protein
MVGLGRTGLSVILRLEFRHDGQQWLGECIELGTATFGPRLEQVQRELKELVELHLNELEDVGERPHFFAEHGIEPDQELAEHLRHHVEEEGGFCVTLAQQIRALLPGRPAT